MMRNGPTVRHGLCSHGFYRQHYLDLNKVKFKGKQHFHVLLLLSANLPLKELMSTSERDRNSDNPTKLAK